MEKDAPIVKAQVIVDTPYISKYSSSNTIEPQGNIGKQED